MALGLSLAPALCAQTATANDAPPPPAGTIKSQLVAAFQRDQEALSGFRHQEHVSTNKDGVTDGRTLRVWYVNGHQVSETIALDGRELSPAEISAEHQRAMQRAADVTARPAPPTGTIVFEGQSYPFARLADDYIYTAAKTRMWRGRVIWVYQAYPNPDIASRSHAETMLLHSQGEVWVDAEDMHVIRIALHTVAPVHYVLGILATIHQATLELDLERYRPGLWLPAEANFQMRATVLLVRPLLRSKLQVYSDYQPN